MLGWFASTLAAGDDAIGGVLSELERAAGRFAPGATGLVALDWWNGNRSVLADADLSGVIAGMTLQTSAAEIYRALLESTAFGNRAVLDNFRDNGFHIDEIVACGGIAEKSPLLMQLFADSTGLPVSVPASPQVPARGSAMFGAVAAGASGGGFASVQEAASALRPGIARTFSPSPAAVPTYEAVYEVWKGLHDILGRSERHWLHELKRLKRLKAAAGTGNEASA
jgi:L-ribulokinase